jgi:16S rRNA (guanine527-N7)-methyltransferase
MENIEEIFCKENIKLTEKQISQFGEYSKILLEYNAKFNLTAITDEEEIMVKHYLDSVLGAKYIKDNSSIVDIGSGAGFPAIPIKIINPTLKFCLLDALNKRVEFLKVVVEKLGLEDVDCLHKRAEEQVITNRNCYDYAVARAVSKLATLAEYALPLLKIGGELIAYKGDNPELEAEEAKTAINILGGELTKIDKFLLNGTQKRSFIIIKKIRKTPIIYPRNMNRPKNNPL